MRAQKVEYEYGPRLFWIILKGLLFIFVGAIHLIGCAAPSVHKENTMPRPDLDPIHIAQPCDTLVGDVDPVDKPYDFVFIEAAAVLASDLPRPLGDWLTVNPVKSYSVMGLELQNGVPLTVNRKSECSTAETETLIFTAQLPQKRSNKLQFTIEQKKCGEVRIATVTTGHQQPVVVDFSQNTNDEESVLIVTPYLMLGQQSRERYFECVSSRDPNPSRPRPSPERIPSQTEKNENELNLIE